MMRCLPPCSLDLRQPRSASRLPLFVFLLLLGPAAASAAQDFTLVVTGDIVNDGGWNYGCAWGDYDNDSDQDLFVVNNESGDKDNFLYRNDGDGTFTRVTTGSIVNDGGSSYGCSWGDYDNDGFLDLFVANYNENNFLYHNNGDGTFDRITTGSIVNDGGSSSCPAWADYDNDGHLDLFVANQTTSNFLYHNNGDGTFTRIYTGLIVTENKNSAACAWGDYDADGFLDLYVANAGPDYNSLFHNDGDGTFTKILGDPAVSDLENYGSVSWGDVDGDGDLDLLTAPGMLPGSPFDIYLYLNGGDGTFTRDTSVPAPVATNAGGGSSIIDYDSDGDLDIFIGAYDGHNLLLENDGTGSFTRIDSGTLVTTGNYSKGTAWADYDLDGDLDLFVAVNNFFGGNNRLFQNLGNSNHWLQVQCVGMASNRSGIGAVVAVKAVIGGAPKWLRREISAQTGGGNASQNALVAHFGLGDAAVVDSVMVSWPSGQVDRFGELAGNQFVMLTEGNASDAPSPGSLPAPFLVRAAPNPFRGQTTITYELGASLDPGVRVWVDLYDVQGRLVDRLRSDPERTGWGAVTWQPGVGASGVYYCRVQAGQQQGRLRLVVAR